MLAIAAIWMTADYAVDTKKQFKTKVTPWLAPMTFDTGYEYGKCLNLVQY